MTNKFYQNFTEVTVDHKLVSQNIKKYNAKEPWIREYFIAITPRSGSSWLTELLASTHIAGNPEEWFNPNHLSGILENYKCDNVFDYMKSIKARQCTANSVFGIEASFYQLKLVLEENSFNSILKDPKVIAWTRKDFVAQGISLFKAVETGYFHSLQGNKMAIKEAEYNATKIKEWILHILYQEAHWETFFKTQGITPLRLTYEDLVSDTLGILKKILAYIDVLKPDIDLNIKTRHQKIANASTQILINKFNQECQDFISICHENRATPSILKLKAKQIL